MDKISIIVPIYNVEKYLNKCIESLIDQTYPNIEIILVNDGTKDNSQKIIDSYVSKYPEKVVAYVKPNGGLSDARNFGIDKANGKYITFVDSDDYVDKTIIEKLYASIIKNEADISVCECYFVYENQNKRVSTNIKNESTIKDAIINLFPAAWGKLYKKEIFYKNTFKKGIWFEDIEFLMRVYPTITKISVVEEPLYNYIQRENSITYTYSDKLNDILNNWDGIVEYYTKNNFYDFYKSELEYAYVRYFFATYIKRLAKSKDYEKFKHGVKNVKKRVIDIFPKYRKNMYMAKRNLKNYYLKSFNIVIATIIYVIEKNRNN